MSNPSPLQHVPVMREAALCMLDPRPGGVYVDGTVGGGGYAEAILEATGPDGVLVALDWDSDAIARVAERLHTYRSRLILEKASFADLSHVLAKRDLGPVDGIVVDLGVSSFQLDDPERGFSFLREGPLDMRMDLSRPYTAADLVNTLQEEELANLIYRLGEERMSRRIARAIVAERRQKPFSGTLELAELIRKVVPKTRDTQRIHAATRTFQALRLAVNGELDALERFLGGALDLLKPGGRLCVVSFHSLEDRMVKESFRAWARACRCPGALPRCMCEGRPLVRLLSRKAVKPDEAEIERNPRARSARLRGLEKLESHVE